VKAITIVIGLTVVGVVIAVVTFWRRSDRAPDLGAVSHQWIAEQRLGSGEDARR